MLELPSNSLAADHYHKRRVVVPRSAFILLEILVELGAILGAAIGTGILYHRVVYGDIGQVESFTEIGGIVACLFLVQRLYRTDHGLINSFNPAPAATSAWRLWNVAFICLVILGFLTKTTDLYSRGWLLTYYAVGSASLLALHFGMARLARLASRLNMVTMRRLYIVGTETDVAEFVSKSRPWELGVDIVGVWHLPALGGPQTAERSEALDRSLQASVQQARALLPDDVLIAARSADRSEMERCVRALQVLPSYLHLLPDRFLGWFRNVDVLKVGEVSCLRLSTPPLSPAAVATKRSFDIVLSAIALVVLSPLFLIVALLIKLDSPGPAFFFQRRHGFNRRTFKIVKFRTMTVMEDGADVKPACRNDPRCTAVGRMLRRWNIDELPQLLNVLRGEMSLVGPRPHALAHDHSFEQIISTYARRHNIKPGITGWAQIHGFRGEIDSEEKLRRRLEHDLYYIDNWSVWIDILALLLTVFSARAYRNAA